jgi:hypothetical protein
VQWGEEGGGGRWGIPSSEQVVVEIVSAVSQSKEAGMLATLVRNLLGNLDLAFQWRVIQKRGPRHESLVVLRYSGTRKPALQLRSRFKNDGVIVRHGRGRWLFASRRLCSALTHRPQIYAAAFQIVLCPSIVLNPCMTMSCIVTRDFFGGSIARRAFT